MRALVDTPLAIAVFVKILAVGHGNSYHAVRSTDETERLWKLLALKFFRSVLVS